jgi:putative CocE/NonD family hydrolase
MPGAASGASSIREIENAWITLADGCRLAARIWLPAGAESVPSPAILEYIPYRKRDFMRRRDDGMFRWFAGQGYAGIRVDMRGSGESEGILADEYLRQEQDDALEVIAWIAGQPWCSGRVGMMGKSWGAFNSLQVAARRPPALKAVIAVMGTDDRFGEDVHYSGGCLLNDNFWWGCVMQVFNARPPDPEVVGERWREMWLERLQAEEFWPGIWLAHQSLDDYWKHGSVAFDYGAIACPVWFWGGWADLYRDTPLRLAERLKVPHRVTVGPWAHLYPHEATPAPAVGFLQEALRWWDHWLAGKKNALMSEPPFQFYLMEGVPPQSAYTHRAGRWVGLQEWPSPDVRFERLPLNAGGRLSKQALPELALTITSPQTTGLASGEWASFGVVGDVPGDQRLDSFGALEFDTEPLTAPIELLGNACATLELAVDRPRAFLAARLIDVAPDNTATAVARGFLNLTHRDGREFPKAAVPGQRCCVDIQLTATAYAFRAGHRMRLAVSTAYWPIVWPSPEPVALTVFTGASRLSLPVWRPKEEQAPPTFPPPAVAPASSVTVLRKGYVERSVTLDPVSREVSHRLRTDGGVFGDWGKIRIDDVGVEISHIYDRIYRIKPDDPTSAEATMTQTYETGRGSWQTRVVATARMSSTTRDFELEASLEAYEGDTRICRRDWKARVPRGTV